MHDKLCLGCYLGMLPIEKKKHKLGHQLGHLLLKRTVSSHEMVAGAAGFELAVNCFFLDAGEPQESPELIR